MTKKQTKTNTFRNNLNNSYSKRRMDSVFFRSCIDWLKVIAKSNYLEASSMKKVLDKITTVHDARGKTECIKYCKNLRKAYVSYLLQVDTGLKGSKLFLPKVLKDFKIDPVKVDEYIPMIRMLLSTLYVSRSLKLEPTPSFKSIIDGPQFTGDPYDEMEDMSRFLKDLGINRHQQGKVPKTLQFKEYHMTSKSGPNGHALWTSFRDLKIIPESLRNSIRVVGGNRLSELMSKFSFLVDKIPTFFESYAPAKVLQNFRKISVIADKEGKSREVAIMDYWSQAALRPLHNKIFKLLSTIDQDCTHNQSKHMKSFRPIVGSRFHSIDLTTATDRFPIVLETNLLRVWFGKEFSKHWQNIMVGYPFRYKDQELYYGTGNPMGAYSSWATFALAHHYLVWKACRNANKTWKRCRYMLLGDDIVIADDAVAEEYKKLLVLWNIPFSPDKSHVSPCGFEFAKQFVIYGRNISPFPFSALFERRNSPIESVGIILSELTNKEWLPAKFSWKPFEDYFLIIQKWKRPKLRSFLPKLKLVISLLRHLQSNEDLGGPLKDYVASTTKKPVKWVPMTAKLYAQYIAGNTVTNLFEEAVKKITSKSNKLPLGELATLMVMHITSLRDGGADCFDLIESVPFLQIYGRAEEKYLQLTKKSIGARLIKDGSEMRSALGKVDFPLSDTDFYIRHKDVLAIHALRASKEISSIIKLHISKNKRYHVNPIMLDIPKDDPFD